jgi:hypothetical protein
MVAASAPPGRINAQDIINFLQPRPDRRQPIKPDVVVAGHARDGRGVEVSQL